MRYESSRIDLKKETNFRGFHDCRSKRSTRLKIKTTANLSIQYYTIKNNNNNFKFIKNEKYPLKYEIRTFSNTLPPEVWHVLLETSLEF